MRLSFGVKTITMAVLLIICAALPGLMYVLHVQTTAQYRNCLNQSPGQLAHAINATESNFFNVNKNIQESGLPTPGLNKSILNNSAIDTPQFLCSGFAPRGFGLGLAVAAELVVLGISLALVGVKLWA